MKAAAQPPIVLGREVGRRVDRQRVGTSPAKQGEVILNVETEPCEVVKGPRSGKRRRLLISRSKSVQGRQVLHLTSHDLDSGGEAESQRIPQSELQPRVESSLLQRTERTSVLLDYDEGCATVPAGLARAQHFERALGTEIKAGEKRIVLLKFLTEVLGVKITPSSNVRISQQSDTSELSVLITGPHSPLSKCCRSTLVFSFSPTHGGKALCTALCCPSRTVSNLYLPASLKDLLWPASELSPTNDLVGMSSFELSTHIRRGSYKVVSLRKEMERRGKLQGVEAGRELGSARGIFTNEKLKHVSPTPPKQAAGMKLPVFQQASALTPGKHKNTVGASPLQSIFHRTNSRHNAVHKQQTPAELIEQLSSLLQPV